MRKFLFALVLLIGGAAMAQAKISPQGIIVNPTPGDLSVRVWIDKDSGHSGNAVYQVGEPIRISVKVNRDAYVYLFNINADGSIDLILPNAYDRNNRLRAGQVRTYPPSGARYRFSITGPEGVNYVLALASFKPLTMGDVADIRSGRARVRGLSNLSHSLSIIVRPVPNREWATDALRYYVGRQAPPPPTTGTLQIESNPSGAKVYVDNAYRGRTPLAFALNPGIHSVDVRLDGYQPYSARVQVRAGQTTRVSPRLVRLVTTGVLRIDSSPQGANIIINGTPVGQTPMGVKLNSGSYDVELQMSGYQPYRARVQVRAGQTTSISPRLQPIVSTGTLEVGSIPSGAKVYVDGAYQGVTPLSLSINAGVHTVEMRLSGYNSFSTSVKVTAGQLARVKATLVSIKAQLEVSVNAPAQVFLDGHPLGKASNGFLRAKVDPGDRELVIIAPGFHAYVSTVHLNAGTTTRINAYLSRVR